MRGDYYQPSTPEAGLPPDAARVDRLLKRCLPGASYDGSKLSWNGTKGRVTRDFIFRPDADSAAALNEMFSGRAGSRTHAETTLLRLIQDEMQRLNDSAMNYGPAYRISRELSEVPSNVRRQASETFQKTVALEAARRKRIERERQELRERQASAAVDASEQKLFWSEQEERAKAAYKIMSAGMRQELRPADFTGVGTAEERAAAQREQDVATERFARQRVEEPELQFGDLLEVFMQVELSRQDWFGAEFVQTSKHDDYFNGTDGVLEWPGDGPESSVRLALDFTVAQSDLSLNKKYRKLTKGTSVRFFRSTVPDAQGKVYEASLQNVPMVILGVDRSMLRRTLDETRGNPEKLRAHPIRALIVEQAYVQIGLQVREACARLFGNVVGNEDNVPGPLRDAVRAYADRIGADRATVRDDPSVVAKIFSGLSEQELSVGFQDKDQGSRLAQLLRVFERLRERHASLKDKLAPAKEWLGKSTTHQRLASGLAAIQALCLGRWSFFGKLQGFYLHEFA
jgi:hypothetical protein